MWLWNPLSPTNSIAFTWQPSNNHGYNTHRPEYAVNFIIRLVFSERSVGRKRKRRAESIVVLQPSSRDCVIEITGWFVPIIAQFIQPDPTQQSECCDLCIVHTGPKELLTNTVTHIVYQNLHIDSFICFLVNDRPDTQFFSTYLFQFSTCFEQSRAHQENQLYQYKLWCMSLWK